ncbi:MAG TPA: LacI family DNA-binding transcriptional regulator [Pseudolysinimonas sp.]
MSQDRPADRRVTIVDIAQRAGVSTSAVSYALNDKPGVSPATREHILAIAAELEWVPDAAARTLSQGRTDTVGLVLSRDPRFLANESFFMEFIAGVEIALATHQQALLVQLVSDRDAEMAIYRRWRAEQRVDGVILLDLERDDSRIELVRRIGLTAVAVGDPSLAGGLPTVWTDDASGVREAVRFLYDLGHRAIARIGGDPEFAHVTIRDTAFVDECVRLGVAHASLAGDFGIEKAEQLTEKLLDDVDSPYTAILYDSGLTAVTGLRVAQSRGIRVPEQLNIVGWDDSIMCTVTDPPISVMSYDVVSYGEHVGRVFNEILQGEAPAAHLDGAPVLHERGSTWMRPLA